MDKLSDILTSLVGVLLSGLMVYTHIVLRSLERDVKILKQKLLDDSND